MHKGTQLKVYFYFMWMILSNQVSVFTIVYINNLFFTFVYLCDVSKIHIMFMFLPCSLPQLTTSTSLGNLSPFLYVSLHDRNLNRNLHFNPFSFYTNGSIVYTLPFSTWFLQTSLCLVIFSHTYIRRFLVICFYFALWKLSKQIQGERIVLLSPSNNYQQSATFASSIHHFYFFLGLF